MAPRLIVDIHMPAMTGVDFIDAGHQIPTIILATAYPDNAAREWTRLARG
jgi:hypothetical protein